MSFQQLKGNKAAIEILQTQIKSASLSNSYLFCGPQGIGKRELALNLSKAINCEQKNADACDKCVSCRKIDKAQHPDLHFVGPQQSCDSVSENLPIKIDDIRQLQQSIGLRPYEAARKVFIIDKAHNLTPEAAGALLKILEEPPEDSVIILITSKPSLLFKTIISRCKIIKLYPLRRQELEDVLADEYATERSLAHYLAYFCEGSLGMALNLKQTDILEQKNRIIDALVFSRSLKFDNLELEGRSEVRSCLNILAAWFKDMYLMKVGLPQATIINLDRMRQLTKSVRYFSYLDIEEIIRHIWQSAQYLEQNINTRLLLFNLKEEIICRVKIPA